MTNLLVVDDEQSICWGLSQMAKQLGHRATIAASAEEGLAAARKQAPDCILLDVRLPGQDGLSAMSEFRSLAPAAPIIVMTAYGDLETAVQAVRNGAFEYLVKPFDLQLAERTIGRALKRDQRVADTTAAVAVGDDQANEQIVGRSPAMQEVFKQIALASPAAACVHLSGESGAGKELAARAIHRYSRRSAGPFVPINVAALSESLAESELFGHVRGAFTGAEQHRRGLLEQAHGGTVFLDEVADIPATLQVKLLRALEHGEIWPVGADRPAHVDFRLVSATHQDLRQLMAQGRFRHDLYYRLVTFEIRLPPLRDRLGDLPELTRHFLTLIAAKNQMSTPGFGEDFIAALARRLWHGNVRELRNALEHAAIVSRGATLLPEHLPEPAPAVASNVVHCGDPVGDLTDAVRLWSTVQLTTSHDASELHGRLLEIVERPLIEAALAKHHGQYSAAARELGLHRMTLKKKMDHFGIAAREEQ